MQVVKRECAYCKSAEYNIWDGEDGTSIIKCVRCGGERRFVR